MTDAVAFAGKSAAGKSAPASLYVYGSVANGTARPGSSDVDLLSIDLPDASLLGQRLSARYVGICRGVEVAAATVADLSGDTDAAYGYRVFLRHYCVHLAGPDPASALSSPWPDWSASTTVPGRPTVHGLSGAGVSSIPPSLPN
jgi:predicted nucleotidyltransferase